MVSIISCGELMHYSASALERRNESGTPIHSHSPEVWSDWGASPQILEVILQAKPDSVALSGSPCWMCYEGSHWATNTFPLCLYLSLHLQEQFNERTRSGLQKKRSENYAEIHRRWIGEWGQNETVFLRKTTHHLLVQSRASSSK